MNGGMECELDASLALWEGSKGGGAMGQGIHLGLRFMELGVLNSWSTFGSTHSHTHKRTQTRLINTSEIFESGFKPSECMGERG